MAVVSRVGNPGSVAHKNELEDFHKAVERDLPYITDRVFMQTLAQQVRARKEVEPRWLESNYPPALRKILADHGMPVDKMPSLGRQEAVTPEQMKGMRAAKFETNPLSVRSADGLQAIALHLQSRQGPPVDTVFVIRQRFAGVHSDWMGESPDNCIESTYVREHNEAVHEGREPDQYCPTCPFPATARLNRCFLPVSVLGPIGRNVNFEAVLLPLLQGTDPLFKLVDGVTKTD